jgi:hypothetical protein
MRFARTLSINLYFHLCYWGYGTVSIGFIVGLAHNIFNKSINFMVRNIMWCMIYTVWEFD